MKVFVEWLDGTIRIYEGVERLRTTGDVADSCDYTLFGDVRCTDAPTDNTIQKLYIPKAGVRTLFTQE